MQISLIMTIKPGSNIDWACQAIRSAEGKSPSREVIVVIDGRDAKMRKAIKALRSPVVTEIRVARVTAGRAKAINKAFALARGQYVGLLDADDWLEPDAVETLFRVLDGTELAFAFSKFYRWENGERNEGVATEYVPHLMPWRRVDIFHFMLARRSSVILAGGMADESLDACIDFDLALRLEAVGQGVSMPQFLYNYRVHPAQMSATMREEQQRDFKIAFNRACNRKRAGGGDDADI